MKPTKCRYCGHIIDMNPKPLFDLTCPALDGYSVCESKQMNAQQLDDVRARFLTGTKSAHAAETQRASATAGPQGVDANGSEVVP